MMRKVKNYRKNKIYEGRDVLISFNWICSYFAFFEAF